MWLMTKIGFYSVVRKGEKFHIRSRNLKDIENLIRETSVNAIPKEWSKADYRFRIIVKERDWKRQIMPRLADLVTYDNFKTECKKTQPDKGDKYIRIWSLMRGDDFWEARGKDHRDFPNLIQMQTHTNGRHEDWPEQIP